MLEGVLGFFAQSVLLSIRSLTCCSTVCTKRLNSTSVKLSKLSREPACKRCVVDASISQTEVCGVGQLSAASVLFVIAMTIQSKARLKLARKSCEWQMDRINMFSPRQRQSVSHRVGNTSVRIPIIGGTPGACRTLASSAAKRLRRTICRRLLAP